MLIPWTEIEFEELPPDMQESARDQGIDFVRYLVEIFGGAMLYVPTLKNVEKRIRNRNIITEYDGQNGSSLAVRYGMSRRQVEKVVRESGLDIRRIEPNQNSIR